MRTLIFKLFAVGFLVISECQAATAIIGPVEIRDISFVGVSGSGHQAGNMEVALVTPFTDTAVNCNARYITTPKSTDPDGQMFSLLMMAKASGRPVQMRISDSPTLSGYNGRCSIMWVTVK